MWNICNIYDFCRKKSKKWNCFFYSYFYVLTFDKLSTKYQIVHDNVVKLMKIVFYFLPFITHFCNPSSISRIHLNWNDSILFQFFALLLVESEIKCEMGVFDRQKNEIYSTVNCSSKVTFCNLSSDQNFMQKRKEMLLCQFTHICRTNDHFTTHF